MRAEAGNARVGQRAPDQAGQRRCRDRLRGTDRSRAAARRCSVSIQRTGEYTCTASSLRSASGSWTGSAVALSTTGIRGLASVRSSRARAQVVRGGAHIDRMERAADVQRQDAPRAGLWRSVAEPLDGIARARDDQVARAR